MKYLNIYELAQAYGGPEEGGWWYTYGEPVESTEVVNLRQSIKTCDDLNAKFRTSSSGYAMGFGDDNYLIRGGTWGDKKLRARIEDHPAEAFPQERPHYE